jgi:predicted acylesterase/phospholipase RssA
MFSVKPFNYLLLPLVAISLLLAGCSSLNSLGGKTVALDKETVNFLEHSPEINLDTLAPQNKRPNQELTSVDFMVSLSGGGQRAAAFAIGVLSELEKLKINANPNNGDNKNIFNALNEIDYMSTVSGGSWAGGAYITELIKHQNQFPKTTFSINEPRVQVKIKENLQKLEMSYFDNCLVAKIERGITKLENSKVYYSDIFTPASSTNKPKVPYIFVNATNPETFSPFVFTQSYFNKYKVEAFKYCGYNVKVNQLGDTPLSLALSASSSVPGFRHMQVTSGLCKIPKYVNTALCKGSPKNFDLIDGGVYDNLGYKTSFKVLSQSSSPKKSLLVIDANATTPLPLIQKTTSRNLAILANTAQEATLSGNITTANHALCYISKLASINTVRLSFSDAIGIAENDPKMKGLGALKYFAELEQIKKFGNPTTHNENKYFWVGLHSRTSYKIGPKFYDAVKELGQLVVRIKAQEILNQLLSNELQCKLN